MEEKAMFFSYFRKADFQGWFKMKRLNGSFFESGTTPERNRPESVLPPGTTASTQHLVLLPRLF
jgi:hypothetical protein